MSKPVNTNPGDSSEPRGSEESAVKSARRGSTGLARAMRLLDVLVADGPLRFAELEERLDLPKATLNRLLGEMIDERLVLLDERTLNYSAGYRVLELANRIWTRSDIRLLARDQLLALGALSGETVQIALHADTRVVVIDHVESTHSVRTSISVGHSAPVYCNGIGKVLLAWCEARQRDDILERISFARYTPNTITGQPELRRELASISKRGYAIDDEEHFGGTCSIAAPIVDQAGQAVAGISITAPTFRADKKRLLSWCDPLIAAAAEVSRRLAPRTGSDAESSH